MAQSFNVSETFEEMVVTAQERAEDVQKVSVSTTVISEEAIEFGNRVTAADLLYNLPKVTARNASPCDKYFIRGIGVTSPSTAGIRRLRRT